MPTGLITGGDVLEYIDPCDPDNIHRLDPYGSEWCITFIPGFGPMDIEILRRTPGITITREPYEPEHLPKWIAVHFKVDWKMGALW